jgi:endonuclease/exonuclease/phosphatase family metal-dependent hydrolase
MFYLHRAVQVVEIRVPGLGLLPLMNVHMEAFDVENNRVHVNRLLKLMEGVPSSSLIIGGDFNALPIGVEKRKGYVDEPDIDFTGGDTMEIFFGGGRMQDAISATDSPEAYTFPADAPTRRLDYLVGDSRGWKLEGRVVGGITGTLSDHLPILATLTPVGARDEEALPPGEGQP